MEDFKVGQQVRVKDDADTSASGRQLRGKVLTITDIIDSESERLGWYIMVKEEDTSGIWLSEVEHYVLQGPEVAKQVSIVVKEGELSVQHTTNSKRSRVGILKQGRVMGHIRFEEIDQYIELLQRLKAEV